MKKIILSLCLVLFVSSAYAGSCPMMAKNIDEKIKKAQSNNKLIGKESQIRLPSGQTLIEKFPVLDLGITPEVSLNDWTLKIFGEVMPRSRVDRDHRRRPVRVRGGSLPARRRRGDRRARFAGHRGRSSGHMARGDAELRVAAHRHGLRRGPDQRGAGRGQPARRRR